MKKLPAPLAAMMVLTVSACGPEEAPEGPGGAAGEARALQCGYGGTQRIFVSNSTEPRLRATLQYNLFEGLKVDAETVAVRTSGNTVRFNTLLRSRNLANRHGEDNLYLGNWVEESEGLLIHDRHNQLRANKCVGCAFGFRVMAGGAEPRAPTTALAPYASDTVLTGNDGPVLIASATGARGWGCRRWAPTWTGGTWGPSRSSTRRTPSASATRGPRSPSR